VTTPDPVVSVEPRWLVCHTRPRCEKKFAALLVAEKLEHYLPLVTSVRRYGKQTKRFTKPLFPGYVFACVPPPLKSRLHQQDLLARTIHVENEALFLRQLNDVRALVDSGYEFALTPPLKKGTRVRVTGGPLWGVEGIVDNPANPQGVILAVDVLQQGLLVKIPLTDLQVID